MEDALARVKTQKFEAIVRDKGSAGYTVVVKGPIFQGVFSVPRGNGLHELLEEMELMVTKG